MIILKYLAVENFRLLREINLHFPQRGSILIQGPNEAGKSTLFESIYFALYGEPLDSNDTKKHARELIVTMAGGLGLRYLAEQAAKAVPIGGDFVAGAIAGAATWSIGQVALEYYEGGKQINTGRMRQLSTTLYRRFRREHTPEELRRYAIEGKDSALLPPPDGADTLLSPEDVKETNRK